MKDDGEWKVCSKCKDRKRLWDFYKDRWQKDGLRCSCKGCSGLLVGTYRRNAIERVQIEGIVTCPVCKVAKPITEFGHDIRRKNGRNHCCKECKKIQNKAYTDRMLRTNPELHRERMREHSHDHYHKSEGWLIKKLKYQEKRRDMGL